MHRLDQITLAGMRFQALVGVLPHEREIPQPLEVDLSVGVGQAMRGDRPAVDYRGLYAATEGVIAGGSMDYIERIAERVADAALGLDGVDAVRVAVRKPHVALGGALRYAEVVLERARSAAGRAPDA